MPAVEQQKQAKDRSARAPVAPLYSKLQPRWCGLDSDGVAENQRMRLFGAMIEAVATRGYRKTSVSELTRMAGVSKRTVYDRFENKSDYFLATYDFVMERAIARIQTAYLNERDPALALCNAFAAFVTEVVDEPGSAKLALVEALGAGPEALERMERGRLVFERMLAASVPGGHPLPPLIVKGIAGGVERVACQYMLDGSIAGLRGRAEELSNWMGCYESAPAELVAAAPKRNPTRASHRWNVWLNGGDESTRILRATAVIAGREGYGALAPERITKLAKVPPDALFDTYESVEECFLASLGLLLGVEALACTARASLGHADWRVGVHLGLMALMEYMAEHPVLGRVAFVEVFAVGPAAMERRGELLSRFTKLLWSRIPESERPSRLVVDLIVGAIWSVAHHCVVHDAKHLLPSVANQMTFLVLAPIVGADEAAQTVLGPCAA